MAHNPLRHHWLHAQALTQGREEEILALLRKQFRKVKEGNPPDCACCGKEQDNWLHVYHCFECLLWFCKDCAKEHFPIPPRLQR